ncbi:MAG: hypothetical protein NW226_20755 [Microscillaceae bacterium]|nr:hypothetical protein [Microscillaceae bacterium]
MSIFKKGIFLSLIMALAMSAYFLWITPPKANKPIKKVSVSKSGLESQIKDGIHQPTGLIADKHLKLVIIHCTGCHSAKLITQNQATREGWEGIIRWMQANQNLQDLGENEDAILDYLAKNYAPKFRGRRPPLENIEWYELKE